MDLANGHWQVPVSEESRPKTALVTPYGGLSEFTRLPFGLSNAPPTFQGLMHRLFEKEVYRTVLIFLDDVLAFSKTDDEHLANLRNVFQIFRVANLKLKPKKCRLFQSQVVYLGHIIDAKGTSPNPDKVRAVKEWKQPVTVTDVRSFIGFCNYYRKFIKDFAEIAQPLHALTKENMRFSWD